MLLVHPLIAEDLAHRALEPAQQRDHFGGALVLLAQAQRRLHLLSQRLARQPRGAQRAFQCSGVHCLRQWQGNLLRRSFLPQRRVGLGHGQRAAVIGQAFVEKMPAPLEQIQHRQIHQAHIVRRGRFDQFLAQVKNRWVLLEIVFVCKVWVVKQTKRLLVVGGAVFQMILALVQPLQKAGVNRLDGVGKILLHHANARRLALAAAPRHTERAPIGRRARLVKQTHAPHVLALAAQHLVMLVRHCPAHRARAHIQTNVVWLLCRRHVSSLFYHSKSL